MSKSYLVGAKTVRFFISKKGGVRREKVVEGMKELVNLSESDAENSISRAVRLGKIKEQKGKLSINWGKSE